MNSKPKLLRDILIEKIYEKMKTDRDIFFLSADFGSFMLDKLRADFKDRFYNVGIAEQNLINVSTGLALEGYTVFAYGIAPFLIMRAYEQIRINLALLSALRPINVNIIGVGAGLSYDVSGPTHHCLEDIGIIRMLPNIELFCPSDGILMEKLTDHIFKTKSPKYLRLDGKYLPDIYDKESNIEVEKGYCELNKGKDVCIVST
ncbi:MAG: transketolase, partial [Candidatus Margulisiibacteriota bacterium]